MNIETVNELIASLESAGELSIKERKYLELAKAYVQLAAENVGLKSFGDTLFDMYKGLEISGGGIHDEQSVVCQQAALDAAMSAFEEIETPVTDRIYAGIKADGLPANIAEIIDSGDLETICYESERSYAEDFRLALYNFRQLREGADK
ncbi:hypothetical protein R7S55_005460 [Raoultella ornithinolytica]|nr:hypothetical protein [Raoultella ornithinolytica]ELT0734792.1 hypothetical protein [Raoultella ornithinolytica]